MFDTSHNAVIAVSAQPASPGGQFITILPTMANRHGLITGATGTGKTVTLQGLAETFSAMGVPVFAADVKGDLSGVAAPGGNKESVTKRVTEYGLAEHGFSFQAFPVQFWDVFGEAGAPVRATVQDMGPLLLSRLLDLNDTQSALLSVVFRMAADEKLDIIDMKDLRKVLEYAGKNAAALSSVYGNIPQASVGAIQRGLIALEEQGADRFFGEPALNIDDLMRRENGKGVINILAADKLMGAPKVYSCFLLWLLDKLFTSLPEVGDPERPSLVFFFDEAHLLFDGAPKAFLEKVEQVVRLIRSKGVGIFFISQVPSDIPDSVLGQLGNRVQHALRAYTPKDQKAVKAAAQSFRANAAFDTEKAIMELGTGEALVSFLDAKGAPNPVARAFILPPEGQVGPLDAEARSAMLASSLLVRYYGEARDRTSAFEVLSERLAAQPDPKALKERAREEEKARREEEKRQAAVQKQADREARDAKRFWTGAARSVVVPLVRQVLGGLFKRR